MPYAPKLGQVLCVIAFLPMAFSEQGDYYYDLCFKTMRLCVQNKKANMGNQ